MGCFINKKQSQLFIYIVLALLLINPLLPNGNNISNNVNSLETPLLLATHYQIAVLSIKHKTNLDIVFRITTLVRQIVVFSYILIQINKYLSYKRLHISKLFIILQRLLLPRINASKYKASLILN
jgi:hypothetical protein